MARIINLRDLTDNDIFFRNLKGAARGKIPAGIRTFCVYVPETMVNALVDDGWKVLEDTYKVQEGEAPKHFIRVRARFDNYPPEIVLMSAGKKVKLTEDTVSRLDSDKILNADIQVRGSVNKNDGSVTAYLSKMGVEVEADWFDEKWSVDEGFEAPDEDIPF